MHAGRAEPKLVLHYGVTTFRLMRTERCTRSFFGDQVILFGTHFCDIPKLLALDEVVGIREGTGELK